MLQFKFIFCAWVLSKVPEADCGTWRGPALNEHCQQRPFKCCVNNAKVRFEKLTTQHTCTGVRRTKQHTHTQTHTWCRPLEARGRCKCMECKVTYWMGRPKFMLLLWWGLEASNAKRHNDFINVLYRRAVAGKKLSFIPWHVLLICGFSHSGFTLTGNLSSYV